MSGPPDPELATQRVMDGTSWAELCNLLKVAGPVRLGIEAVPQIVERADLRA